MGTIEVLPRMGRQGEEGGNDGMWKTSRRRRRLGSKRRKRGRGPMAVGCVGVRAMVVAVGLQVR